MCDFAWQVSLLRQELVDTFDEELLLQLSRILGTEILRFFIQTSSSTFAFAAYNDTIKRHIFISDGEISTNSGAPLEPETGLNMNENIFADDLLKLAEPFGIDLEGKSKKTYSVKQLVYEYETQDEFRQHYQQQDQEATIKKPWWKFW